MRVSLTDLEQGATYQLQFAGVRPDGSMTEFTNTYTVTLAAGEAPEAPANPNVAYSGGAFIVSWTPSTDPDVDYHIVEVFKRDPDVLLETYIVRAPDSSFRFTKEFNDQLNATPIDDPLFKIYTVDRSGLVSSPSVDVECDDVSFDKYPLMNAPTGLTGVGFPKGIAWEWEPPTQNADILSYYQIDIDLTAYADPFDAEPPKILTPQYTFAGLASQAYGAKVVAYDIFGRPQYSAASSPVSTLAISAGDDTTPPGAPGAVSISSDNTDEDGISRVVLTWGASSTVPKPTGDLAGYMVQYRVTAETGDWSQIVTAPDVTSVVIDGLKPNTEYSFQVAAFDGDANYSAYTVAGSTHTTPPPTGPDPISGAVTVNWTNPELLITFADTRTSGTLWFSHYEVDITKNSITKTFQVAADDKRLVVTPEMWKSTWPGQAPSLPNADIDVYAVDVYAQRSTAVNPTLGPYTFSAPTVSGTPTVLVGDEKITVTWTAATAGTVARYDVWAIESLNGATNPTSAKVVATTQPTTVTATFPARVSDPTFEYGIIVNAVDVYGQHTPYTKVVSGDATAAPAVTIYAGIDAMKAVWTPVANHFYRVEIQEGAGAWSTIISKTTGSEASWQTNGSTNNWTVRLTPFNGIGTTGATSTDTEQGITVAGSDGTAPDAPTALSVTAAGTTEDGSASLDVDFTGSASSDVWEYEVRWTTTDNQDWTSASMAATSPSAAETYRIRNLSADTLYYAEVAALDKTGNRSSFVDAGSDTTDPTPQLATPVGVLTGDYTLPDLSLSWTDSASYGTHFWGYEVRISTDSWSTYKKFEVPRRSSGGGGTFLLSYAENKNVFGTAVTTFPINSIRIYSKDIFGKYSNSYITNSDTGGNSGALTNAAPTSPGTPTFTYAAGAITATWTPETAADFKNYRVVVTKGATSRTYTLEDKTTPKFTLSFAENKSVFGGVIDPTFQITTEDVAGYTTTGAAEPADYPAMATLAAPTGTGFLEGVSFTWTAPTTGADIVKYYDVDVEAAAGTTNFSTIDGSELVGLNFAKSGLTGGAQYKAAVRATDIFNPPRTLESADSSNVQAVEITAPEFGDGLNPPNAPTWAYSNASTDFAGNARVTLTITYSNKPTDFSHYSVKWGTSTGVYNDSIVTVEPSVVITGLAAGTTYYFLIEAYDVEGKKNASSTETTHATSGVAAMQSPTGAVTASFVGNVLRVSWTDTTTYNANTFGGYKVVLNNNGSKIGWTSQDKIIDITPEMQVEKYGTSGYPDNSFASGEIDVYSYSAINPNSFGATPVTKGTTTSKTAPTAPASLSLAPAVGSMTATWAPNASGDGVVKYKVLARAGSSPGGSDTYRVYEGVGTSVTFDTQTANPGTQWYVQVYAIDGFGTPSSASATNQASKVVISGIENPTGVVTGTYTSANLVVTWTDTQTYPSGLFAGYAVRITANSKTYTWDVPQSVNSTEKGKLILDQQDQYQAFGTQVLSYAANAIEVYARDINGKLCATSMKAGLTTNAKPGVPTSLQTSTSTVGVTASWTEPADTDVANGAGSYIVEIHSASGWASLVKQLTVRVPNVTYNGLAHSTPYWIRVRAVDSVGQFATTGGTSNVGWLEGTFNTPGLASDTQAPPLLTTSDFTLSTVAKPEGKFDLVIDWSAYSEPPDIYRYRVEWGTADGGPYTSNAYTSSKTFTVENLPRSGSTYYVVISAFDYSGNNDGQGAQKSIAAVPVWSSPPTNLTATWNTNDAYLRLGWDAPSTSLATDLSHYKVTLTGTAGSKSYTTLTNSFEWTPELNRLAALTTGATYTNQFVHTPTPRIAVVAVSDTGDESSVLNNTATYTNSYTPAYPDATVLSVGLRAMSASWSAVPGAAEYILYAGLSTLPTSQVWRGTALTASFQTVNSQPYYARHRAVNAINTLASGYATQDSETSQEEAGADNTPPGVPTGTLTVTPGPTGSSDLTYLTVTGYAAPSGPPPDFKGYRVLYGKGASPTTWSVITISSSETSVVIEGLDRSQLYSIKVFAYDSSNNVSTTSLNGSQTTAGYSAPANPTNGSVTGTWDSDGNLRIVWVDATSRSSEPHFAGYEMDITLGSVKTIDVGNVNEFVLTLDRNKFLTGGAADTAIGIGHIKIYAVNKVGARSSGYIQNAAAADATLPSSQTLTLTPENNQIIASWPSFGATIAFYEVDYGISPTGSTFTFSSAKWKGTGLNVILPTPGSRSRWGVALRGTDIFGNVYSATVQYAVAQSSDTGLNILPKQYALSESVPTVTGGSVQIPTTKLGAYIAYGDSYYEWTNPSVGHILWFGTSASNYNVPLGDDVNLRASSYMSVTGGTATVRFRITPQTGGVYSGSNIALTGTTTRVSNNVGTPSGTTSSGIVGIEVMAASGTPVIRINASMVEQVRDTNSEASGFNANSPTVINGDLLVTGTVQGDVLKAQTAFISNITLDAPGDIQSENYIADGRGFRIAHTGDAEFNNVRARGRIEAEEGNIGGWGILKDDILSTSDSVSALFLPGDDYNYVESTTTTAPTTSAQMEFNIRLAAREWVRGTSSNKRLILQKVAGSAHNFTIWIDDRGYLGASVGSGPTSVSTSTAVPSDDGSYVWVKAVLNFSTSSYAPTGGATTVTGDKVAFFLADGDSLFPPLSGWTIVGSQLTMTTNPNTASGKFRIGGPNVVPATAIGSPFTGAISDIYFEGFYSSVPDFRVATVNRSTDSVSGEWYVSGRQVGVSAAAVESLVPNSDFMTGVDGWYAYTSATSASGNPTSNTTDWWLGGKAMTVPNATNNFVITRQPSFATTLKASSGLTRTITATGHNLLAGDTVVVAHDTPDTDYDGTWVIDSVTSTTFTYTNAEGASQTESIAANGDVSRVSNDGLIRIGPNRTVAASMRIKSASLTDSIAVTVNYYDENKKLITESFTDATAAPPQQTVVANSGDGTYTYLYFDDSVIHQFEEGDTIAITGGSYGGTTKRVAYVNYGTNSVGWLGGSVTPYTTDTGTVNVSGWYSWYSDKFTSPPSAYYATLKLSASGQTGNAVVDCVRIDAGAPRVYGFAYSATDSIRLESYGALNIVNNYGRIDITNTQVGDSTELLVDDSETQSLSPTIRMIASSSEGKDAQAIPGEILPVGTTSVDSNTGSGIRLHSGSVYSETDKIDIAQIQLIANTNPNAGPGVNDEHPNTSVTIAADDIDLSAILTNISGHAKFGGRIEGQKVVSNGEPLSSFRARGSYADYAAFEQEHGNTVDFRNGDMVIVENDLRLYSNASNSLSTGGFVLEPAQWTGYDKWNENVIEGLYGSISSTPTGGTITSPAVPILGDALAGFVEGVVQYFVIADSTTILNGNFNVDVDFYTVAGAGNGTANLNGIEISTTEYVRVTEYFDVPDNTSYVKFRFSQVGSQPFSIAKVYARNTTKAVGTAAMTVGTNLLNSTTEIFTLQDLDKTIVVDPFGAVGSPFTTTITGIVDGDTIYTADDAPYEYTSSPVHVLDVNYTTPALNNFSDAGDVSGPPGPAPEFTTTTEVVYDVQQAGVTVSGVSPNVELGFKIPAGPATYAQVNTDTPVARAEGDMWFDISKPPSVPSLMVTNDEFTDGLQVYNDDQSEVIAKIGPTASLTVIEPAPWITPTLTSPWSQYSVNFETFRYYKDPFGVVHCRGLIRTTDGVNYKLDAPDEATVPIHTFPVGYRPSNTIIFTATGVYGAYAGEYGLYLSAAGKLHPNHFSGVSGTSAIHYGSNSQAGDVEWITLTGVSWRADQ